MRDPNASQRVDFSSNAHVYDNRHGSALAPEFSDALIAELELKPNARILDIGAGTGRVSVPLAERGLTVCALDAAHPMLRVLRRKTSASSSVFPVLGDATRLPFHEDTFDAVVFARLLYLVPAWKALVREAVRVARPPIRIGHEWGNGESDEPWAQVRDHTRALFEGAGVKNPFHPGARTEREIDGYILDLGLRRTGELRRPGATMHTLREFIRRIEAGEASYIWNVPESVQRMCLPELTRWAESRFDLDAPMPIPREVVWRIYAAD